jgi:hypothetical protein
MSLTPLEIVLFVLSGLYIPLVILPLVQLIRIHFRAPEVGWTTQKLFLTLTALSSIVRAVFFAIVYFINGGEDQDNLFMDFNLDREPLFTLLNNLPRIIYFSTYTLLILFWALIIHQVRHQSKAFTQRLRPIFFTVNVTVYLVQILFWILLFCLDQYNQQISIAENMFFCAISLLASLGFVLYGGKLYWLLKNFPLDTAGRASKLREVGAVTVICTFAFIGRAVLLAFSTFAPWVDLNPYFVGVYFSLVEVVPSMLVLFVLRKLPPARESPVNQNNVNNHEESTFMALHQAE